MLVPLKALFGFAINIFSERVSHAPPVSSAYFLKLAGSSPSAQREWFCHSVMVVIVGVAGLVSCAHIGASLQLDFNIH